MHLTIDAGNTRIKYALFENGQILTVGVIDPSNPAASISQLFQGKKIHSAIISSVRSNIDELIRMVSSQVNTLVLSHELRFPFSITYQTPHTIGNDRLANAAGAIKYFLEKPALVVDCGTCITYTLLSGKKLVGGTISPGIEMRFRALHHFTGNLPLLTDATEPIPIPGKNTHDSIVSGVINAIVAETDGMIEQYCSTNPELNVILTGGHRPFFEKHLKSPIFAVPFLTHEGLHEILLLNQ
jgi:type III pantothenate kinase